MATSEIVVSDELRVRRKLEALVLTEPTFTELGQKLSPFNVFEAVGVTGREVQHSQFLAHLLDPTRTHGFGDAILQRFLDTVLDDDAVGRIGLSALNIHVAHLDRVEVRREWKQTDITLILPTLKLVVVVELKIEASEGKDQLSRYQKAVEDAFPSGPSGWKHLFIFLTKYEDEPSQKSWIGKSLGAAIEKIAAEPLPAGEPSAQEALLAYRDMIRRHHMSGTELDNLARQLWSKHRDALEFLADRRPDEIADLLNKLRSFIEPFNSNAANGRLRLVLDSEAPNYFRFLPLAWDEIPDLRKGAWGPSNRILRYEVVRAGKGRNDLRASLLLGPGPDEVRRRIYSTVKHLGIPDPDYFGHSWKTLAAVWLFRSSNREFDLEEVSADALTKLVKFVDDTSRRFTDALVPVLGKDGGQHA